MSKIRKEIGNQNFPLFSLCQEQLLDFIAHFTFIYLANVNFILF